MTGRPVLVTGHLGYIGAALTPRLEAAGYVVVGCDTAYFEEPYGANGGRHVPRDVRDIEPADLEGIWAIVHLAALSNDPLGNVDPSLTAEINHEASVRLATMARDAGVERFVFSSSCSVYGFVDEDTVLTESDPLNPLTPYAESKVATEQALHELASDDFVPTSLRNATAYGGSPRLRTDLVVNNLAAGEVRLNSDGRASRPLVHVDDICSAVLAVLGSSTHSVSDQVFNIGRQGDNYRIVEVAEQVAEAVPGSRVVVGRPDDADARSYRVDFSRILAAVPAYRPSRTVLQGAREVAAAIRAGGFDRDVALGRRHIRLAQLTHLIELGVVDARLRWVESPVSR